MSRLIVYAVEEVASLGVGTPLVVEQVTTLCASWAAKIGRWRAGDSGIEVEHGCIDQHFKVLRVESCQRMAPGVRSVTGVERHGDGSVTLTY